MSKTACCTSCSKTAAGTSNKGDLQEALRIAVSAALAATGVADGRIKWKLECVSGVDGGFAPVSDLTVEISYELA